MWGPGQSQQSLGCTVVCSLRALGLPLQGPLEGPAPGAPSCLPFYGGRGGGGPDSDSGSTGSLSPWPCPPARASPPPTPRRRARSAPVLHWAPTGAPGAVLVPSSLHGALSCSLRGTGRWVLAELQLDPPLGPLRGVPEGSSFLWIPLMSVSSHGVSWRTPGPWCQSLLRFHVLRLACIWFWAIC